MDRYLVKKLPDPISEIELNLLWESNRWRLITIAHVVEHGELYYVHYFARSPTSKW